MEADAFDPSGWSQVAVLDGALFHEESVRPSASPATLANSRWTYDW
jgi:hypothetical protein